MERMRKGCSENETTRFDRGDLVDRMTCIGVDERVDDAAKCIGIAEQGGDVPKLNTGLGEVGNGANVLGDVHERPAPHFDHTSFSSVLRSRSSSDAGNRSSAAG